MTGPTAVANLTKLRVLIVDDNEHARTLLRTLLAALGIRTIYDYGNGQDALRSLGHTRPDFAIIDFLMTPMDGLALTKAIRGRKLPNEAYLPIIMITGHTERRRIEAARDTGVTEILLKPLTMGGLIHRIEQIILRPRPFVRCDSYFGPSRRRRKDPNFMGPWRRSSDGTDDPEFDLETINSSAPSSSRAEAAG